MRANVVRQLKEDAEPIKVTGPDDPKIAEISNPADAEIAAEEIALAREAQKPFDVAAFLEGHLTPVFFGSALKKFGVQDLIDALAEFAPPPQPVEASTRRVDPREAENDRLCVQDPGEHGPQPPRPHRVFAGPLGRLVRGMKARLSRTGKNMAINAPQFFFAQDRQLAEEAFAGDVVGIPNHGALRIGDTLTDGENLVFRGVPSFAPEILRRVKARRRDEGQKAARGLAANGRGRGGAAFPAA